MPALRHETLFDKPADSTVARGHRAAAGTGACTRGSAPSPHRSLTFAAAANARATARTSVRSLITGEVASHNVEPFAIS